MKKLFKNYQTQITMIEDRIAVINDMIKLYTGKDRKMLEQRRDTLKEEYNDLIAALHDMVKYVDERPRTSIRREAAVN